MGSHTGAKVAGVEEGQNVLRDFDILTSNIYID